MNSGIEKYGAPNPVCRRHGCAAEGTHSAWQKWRDNVSSPAITAAAGEPFR